MPANQKVLMYNLFYSSQYSEFWKYRALDRLRNRLAYLQNFEYWLFQALPARFFSLSQADFFVKRMKIGYTNSNDYLL